MFGQYNEDGSVASYPDKNILGVAYDHPATTYRVDATRFVVLPSGGLSEDRIKELINVHTENPTGENVRKPRNVSRQTEDISDK